ncbi:MAG: hypothetical protein WAQ28_00150 [Bacteroidia bacterium]
MNKTSTKKNLSDSKLNKEMDDAKDFPYEPGDNIINNILNYSKALSVRKSKQMEYFEMVLN